MRSAIFTIFVLALSSISKADTGYSTPHWIELNTGGFVESQTVLYSNGTYDVFFRMLVGQQGMAYYRCESLISGEYLVNGKNIDLVGLGKGEFKTCFGAAKCIDFTFIRNVGAYNVLNKSIQLQPLTNGWPIVISTLPACE